MRTTITLDDDLYAKVSALAKAQKRSAGKVLSELLRPALERPVSVAKEKGRPVFRVPRNAPKLTHRAVRAALAEEDFE